jgi:hypothetical protein
MRSFAKIVLVVAAVTAALGGIVEAQSARGRYTEGLASETRLRRELDAHAPSAAPDSVLRRIRTLVEAYERMSREFPASGYMDNALWQGAMLAADAFRAFGEAADRTTAIRMFSLIEARFPTSSLVPKAAAQSDTARSRRKMTSPSSPGRGWAFVSLVMVGDASFR